MTLKKLSPESAAPVSGKEELRKKFDKACDDEMDRLSDKNLPTEDMWNFVFDFFWGEIEEAKSQSFALGYTRATIEDIKRDEELERLRSDNEELRKRYSANYGGGFTEEEITISSLRSLVKAADQLAESLKIENRPNWAKITNKTEAALENYQQLKQKI